MSAESEFVFDAVIGFLTSPIWNFPVRTFIEENSLVFDPYGENHEAFQEIHIKYKSMVEALLSSFLKDVGITEEQFIKACKAGSGSPQFRTMNRDVFDQMWAAEDFEVFKRLMTQKNIELQLQALQIIQQRHNVQMAVPTPYTSQGVPPPTAPGPAASAQVAMDEDAIMQEVLRRSKEEYELQQKDAKEKTADHDLEQSLALSKEESERLKDIARREQEEMERVLKTSFKAQRKQTAEAEKMRDEAKQTKSKSETKPSTQLSPVKTKSAPTPTPEESKAAPKTSPVKNKPLSKPGAKLPEKAVSSSLPPIAGKSKKPEGAPSDKAAEWISNAKNDVTSNVSAPSAERAQYTEEELKRRTEYLKQQRDKLLALKKQEREKHLTKYTEQQPKARPTSSQAARRVTAGEQLDSPSSTNGGEDGKKLAMRRALAECLKREVVDNK